MSPENDDHDRNRESSDERPNSTLAERYPGLEVLRASPENAQTDSRENLAKYLTPREQHYIRNHYRTPEIDRAEWTVSLTGMVDESIDLSMDEPEHDFSTESVVHTMECSGNGRAYFEPDADGDQWTFGAIGTTVWTGTPLRDVLAAYGAATDEGPWLSVMGGETIDDENVFCRSIPMSKIVDDCLLASEMNGSPMRSEHGYPVRLVVPGWFGNNSAKWVDRIHVTNEMVSGEEWRSKDGRDYTEYQQSSYRIVPAGEDASERYADVGEFSTYDQLRATDGIENAYFFDQLVKSIVVNTRRGRHRLPLVGGRRFGYGDRVVRRRSRCARRGIDGRWRDLERRRVRRAGSGTVRRPEVPVRLAARPGNAHVPLAGDRRAGANPAGDDLRPRRGASGHREREVPLESERLR